VTISGFVAVAMGYLLRSVGLLNMERGQPV
jgi:hypothetical protein